MKTKKSMQSYLYNIVSCFLFAALHLHAKIPHCFEYTCFLYWFLFLTASAFFDTNKLKVYEVYTSDNTTRVYLGKSWMLTKKEMVIIGNRKFL